MFLNSCASKLNVLIQCCTFPSKTKKTVNYENSEIDIPSDVPSLTQLSVWVKESVAHA